ncbi:hypothetical protein HMPREF1984_00627 [Leptotrichia sp. oral taxon 215 str. W9775]|nr:hypothetical protein HMPREF1984_00627 [Leptotrichia sp. oral taxon 215 str. W9775]
MHFCLLSIKKLSQKKYIVTSVFDIYSFLIVFYFYFFNIFCRQ